MNRKQLEIQLSQIVDPFKDPKIEFEQYQTPARVAANLLHIAWTRDDIEEKSVIDLCAGTGILGIGAVLLGADVTLVEKEKDAFDLLLSNIEKLDINMKTIHADVLSFDFDQKYDTAILNPPFGIQQRKERDLDFVKKASTIANEIYSIHDGSETNQQQLPDLFEKMNLDIIEAYIDEFPLNKSYPWHTKNKKMYQVLIIHSSRS